MARFIDRESEESGPIQTSIWDTRTRENSRWCRYCEHWLQLNSFAWMGNDLDKRLEYHQTKFCRLSPTYNPQG